MRNRLPSLLTAARFPLALGLLAAEVSTRFLALYLLCCLTDVLDGLAARRLNACSAFGARLAFCTPGETSVPAFCWLCTPLRWC